MLSENFSQWIGLEALQDFKLSTIFSEVFKRHTRDEMEDQLIMGTARHTPSLEEIQTGWARPWLFARMLGVSALLAFLLYQGYETFDNTNLIPGLIFVGSFAVPASGLIFFLEMNAPRNVSLFSTIGMVFIGGIASLMVSLVLYSPLKLADESWFTALAAGVIEETAKLAIVLVFVGRVQRYSWLLNGLLLGAAVGTGFAAFESAGYAFNALLENSGVQFDTFRDVGIPECVHSIELRGVLAPFGHIVWTANAAAAVWMVKGRRPFAWHMLQSRAFLRIAAVSVGCHFLWDAPFRLVRLPVFIDLKYLLLGVLAWGVCFRLVQAGLRQVAGARADAGAEGK